MTLCLSFCWCGTVKHPRAGRGCRDAVSGGAVQASPQNGF